jgi:hypothetical protein
LLGNMAINSSSSRHHTSSSQARGSRHWLQQMAALCGSSPRG